LALKIDFHVHTCYSRDGITTPEQLIKYAKKQGLDGVAVTDHDTTEGALKLAKNKEIIVIPGVEVSTLHGHVLALNVMEPVSPKLNLHETTEKIRELGGIAVAAHPSVIMKGLRTNIFQKDLKFDAIEVVNSAAFPFSLSTYLSRRMAETLHLPQTGGSDAHYPPEIGFAYTLIEAVSDVEEIIESIRKGKTTPFGKAIPWRVRFAKEMLRLKRKLR